MNTAIEIGLGDGLVLDVEVTEDGAAKDITGWTILFTIKKTLSDSDADAVVSKDITSHSDPVNGISLIAVPEDELTEAGIFHANVRFLDSVGDEYPESSEDFILESKAKLSKQEFLQESGGGCEDKSPRSSNSPVKGLVKGLVSKGMRQGKFDDVFSQQYKIERRNY